MKKANLFVKSLGVLALLFCSLQQVSAQFTCPQVYYRNNGNGGASSCPGVGATAIAPTVVGTQYATVPTTTKTGNLTMKFTTSQTVIPVITNVWINGAASSCQFGPPSAEYVVGGNYHIDYCFYNTNLPNAGSNIWTVRFVNPSNGQILGECSYDPSDVTATTPTLDPPLTPPTISAIPDYSSCLNGYNTGAISFTIGDAETATTSLTVTATSSNTTLVPNGNITLGGSGANRTITVATVAGQTGTTTITVLVSDGDAMQATETFTVTRTTSNLAATLTAGTRPCSPSANGSMTANITGGTAPFTYAWTRSNTSTGTYTSYAANNNTNPTNLSSGWYKLTVTDACGSITTTAVQLAAATSVTINSSSSALTSCNAGTVTLLVQGGIGTTKTATLTDVLNSSNVYTATPSSVSAGVYTITLSNVPVGTYSVSVAEQGSACTTAGSNISLTPVSISGVATSQVISCYGGSNGALTVTAANGTAPYTYAWYAGPNASGTVLGTNASITGLAAGDYTVLVTDALSCTANSTYQLTEPDEIVPDGVPSNSLCSNTTDGAISSVNSLTTGGTGAYTYAWTASNGGTVPSGQSTNANLTGLGAGDYTVVVTDANGCTGTNTFTISAPAAVSFAGATVSNVTCYGAGNGSITANLSGGNTPYSSYSWSNGTAVVGTSANISNLVPGSYTLTVVDGNLCTFTSNAFTITQPNLIAGTLSTTTTAPVCQNASSPTLTFTGSGSAGVNPYTFTYTIDGGSPLTLTTSGSNLTYDLSIPTSSAGTFVYALTQITDNTGCSVSVSGQSQSFTVLATPTVTDPSDIVACGLQTVSAVVLSGTDATSYTWTNSNTAIGLAASGTANSGNQYEIPSFTATNTSLQQTATITVTPNNVSGGTTCAGSSETYAFTINQTPVLANGTDTICSGDTFTYTPGGSDVVPSGTTYTWTVSSNTNLDESAQPNSQNTFSQTLTNTSNTAQVATYTVTPTANGCTGASFTVAVTVNPRPSVQAQSLTVCSDAAINYIPTNGGSNIVPAGTTYTWTVTDNANTTGEGDQSSAQTSVSQTIHNNGTTPEVVSYTVTPNNGACVGTNFTLDITVNPTPTVANVNDVILCAGDQSVAIPFSGTVNGTVYNWTNSSTTTGLAASGTGTIGVFTATNSTNASITSTVTVTPVAPEPAIQPSNPTTLLAMAYGTTNTNRNVTYSNINLNGTNSTIASVNAGSTVSLSFNYNTSNSNPHCPGCVVQLYLGIGGTSTTVWCANGQTPSLNGTASVTFTAPATAGTYYLVQNATYEWNCISQNFSAVPSNAMAVIIVNGPVPVACYGTPETFTITVNPDATSDAGSDASICSVQTHTLNGTIGGGASSATWTTSGSGTFSNNSSLTAVYTPSSADIAAGSVTITLTTNDPTGPCNAVSDNLVLTILPSPSVADQSTTLCSDNALNLDLDALISGTGDTYTYTVSSSDQTNVPAGSDRTTASASNITDTYTNTTGSDVTITYTVTPIGANGCNGNTFTYTVTVNPEPLIVNQTTSVCSGSTFTATPSNGNGNYIPSGTTYTWSAPTVSGITGTASGSNSSTITGTLSNTTNGPINVTYTISPANGSTPVAIGDPYNGGIVAYIFQPSDYGYTPGKVLIVYPSYVNAGICSAPGNQFTMQNQTATTNTGIGYGAENTSNLVTAGHTSTSAEIGYVDQSTLGGQSDWFVPSSDELVQILTNLPSSYFAFNGFFIRSSSENPTNLGQTYAHYRSGASLNSTFQNDGGCSNGIMARYDVINSGCAGSDFNLTVTVNPTPVIANKTATICDDGTFTIAPSNGGAEIVPANTTYTYVVTSNSGVTGASDVTTASANISQTLSNNTDVDQTVVYTVTPTSGAAGNCVGATFTVTVTVRPAPIVANQTVSVCTGTATGVTIGNDLNTPLAATWNITSINAANGLSANGGNASTGTTNSNSAIQSDVFDNTTNASKDVVYTITPISADGCSGTPFTVTATFLPEPTVNTINDQTVCVGAAVSQTFASTFNAAGTEYMWSNTNTAIGLEASGFGDIASFTTTNATNTPISGTVTVTPYVVNGGGIFHFDISNGNSVIAQAPAGAVFTNVEFASYGNPTGSNGNYIVGSCSSANSQSIVEALALGNNSFNVTANSATFGSSCPNGSLAVRLQYSFICEGTPETFDITVNPIPTVDASSDILVCNGSPVSATFTSSFAVSSTVYTWSNDLTTIGLGATNTGDIASFNGTNTGTSAVTANVTVTPSYTNNSVVCTGTADAFTITVNPTPTVNTVPNQIICTGDNTTAVNFTGAVAGTTFPWTNDNTVIGLSSPNTGNISSFVGLNGTDVPVIGNITVTPTTTGGITCTGTPRTFSITVNPTPEIEDVNEDVCNNYLFTYQPSTGGGDSGNDIVGANTTYTWSAPSAITGVSGLSAGTNETDFHAQVVNTTNAVVTVTYTVTPTTTNANGSPCVGQPFDVTLNVGPTFTIATQTAQICSGEQFLVTPVNGVNGNVIPSGVYYEWNAPSSVNVTGMAASGNNGESNISGTLINVTAVSQVITYSVTPYFDNNGVTCSGAPFNVAVTVLTGAPSVSVGSDLTTCSNDTAEVSVTTVNAIFGSWSSSGSGVFTPGVTSTTIGYLPSAADLTSGSVSLTYTATNGCGSNSDDLVVTVIPAPTVDAGLDATICFGGTATLTAATTGLTSYSWSNGATTASITVSPTATTTYTFTGQAVNGCSNTDEAQFIVNPLPLATISTIGSTTVCDGGSMTLLAPSGSGYAYQWNENNTPIAGANSSTLLVTTSGSYTVTITDGNGCVNTTATPTVVTVVPPVVVSVNSETICNGSSAVLTASGATNYVWSNGATGSTITVNPTSNTSYTVTGSTNGCSGSAVSNVTVNPIPPIEAITGATEVCVNSTTLLANATTGGTWSTSNGAVASVSSAGLVTGLTTGSTTITYTINVNGCSNAVSAVVNVNSGATATITAGGATTFCAGGSVVLTASAGASYLWSNGAQTQSITVTASGSYYVTVNSASGCSATSTATLVTVTPNPVVDIYGATDLCVGQTELYSSNITGGTWSSTLGQTVVDQSNTQYMNQAGAPSQYQTFTAGQSGTLSSISLNHANPQGNTAVSTVTVNVYSGTGTSGTLLGSNSVTLPAQWGSTWNVYSFSGISITQGQVYTFEVTTPTVVYSWLNVNVNNPYAGGEYGPSISGWDMVFETNVTPAGGSITTGGQFTASTAGNATISYSVTQNGCTTTATYPVTINTGTTATITAGGATTFCAGGSVTLTANSGSSYLWSNGAQTQSITVTAGGSYYVTVTNASGCSATSTSTTVTVNPLPTVAAITGATNVCSGLTTQLASATTGGTWTSSNTAVATVSATGVVTGVTAGTATMTYSITDANGCTNSVTATVNVNAGTTATITAGGATTFCAGGSVTLTANSGSSYLWSNGAQTQSITVTAGGSYYVTVTNASGCSATSTSTTVTVNPLPTVAAITGATNVCSGLTTQLASATTGGTWTSSNTAVATVSATGVVTGVTAGTATMTYSITDANGCTNSVTATVNVNAGTTATITAGGATTFCAGGSVTLTANSGSSYLWSNGAQTQSITVTAGGSYYVTVTNASGCSATSTSTTVTVNPLPTVAAITGATNVCSGLTTQLASATTGGTWTSSNTAVATVSATGVVTGVTAGTATMTYSITDANGCTNSVTATVNVNAGTTATITAGGATTFCAGGSVTLTANSGSSYLWSNGAQTQSITVTAGGSYYVTVTNASGCSATSTATEVTVNALPTANILANGPLTFCQGGSVTLSASPVVAGNTYLWSNGATTASINVTSSATITVTVTSAAGCSTTSLPTSVNVFTNPTATITASGATTFCQGGSVTLTANAGTGYSYQWSNNTNNQVMTATTAGSYTVTVTDANGCSVTSAPTVVTVNALPTTAAITGTNSVCIGGTTLLSTTATNPVWSSANTAVATVAANGLVTGVSAGTVVVSYTITNANGCTNTASVTVTVNQLPTAAIATVGATTFCQGGSVTLLASNAPAGMTYTYQWGLNGTAITSATSNTYVANASGNYSVTITTNSGCAATSAATTVTVNPLPVLAANTGSASVCENGTVTLANAQAGGLWSTANNTIATINAVTGLVTGVNPGTTTLTYTFTNANGCTNSVSTNFTVNALPAAVITANGTTTFCQGGSVVLTANTGSSYLWSNGQTTQSITVSNTSDITVTVTNANGCSATSAITSVVVNALPVANITSLNGNSFCQGGSVTLVASTGSSYAWSNGAFTQSVTVSSTQTLTVTVTNSDGCSATSAPFTVTMNAAPVATITANGPTTFCAGGSVTLSAPAAASYLWSSGETTQTIVASVDGPYTVTLTDGNGCSATSANMNITVNNLPTVQSIAGNNTVCAGSTSTLTNATIGGTWTSSNAAIATVSSTGVVTGVAAGTVTMTYTVTNASGCSNAVSFNITVNATPVLTAIAGTAVVCEGATTLLANAQANGTWSSSDVAIATVAANGVVSGLNAGSATITYTYTNAEGCTSSVSQALVVNALPSAVVTASGATTFCAGGSVILTAPAGMTYAWSTGEPTQSITVSTSGAYAVTITNANGCAATSAPVAVTVNALPTVAIANIGATTFCQGGDVTLISPLNSTYSYAWSNGATAITGATSNTYVATASGSYALTVTDANGCTATSAAIPVTVNALPVVTATANGATTFCQGGSVTINAAGAATYVWSNGATTPSITLNASEVVTVTGTTVDGCSSVSNAISVVVNPLPTATITSTGSTACLGSSVTLTANGGATYSWSNGSTNQSITVTAGNTYTVTVTSAAGCTSTASETVTFNANPAVTIAANGPTVFCQGGSLTLTATGGSNYVWSNGDQGASTTVAQSGAYFVVVTNAAGCTTQSSVVNVTVNAAPVVAAITGANTVCEGGNMTLTSATPGGVWTSANNFIATIDGAGNVTGLNAGSTTITYTVSNNGCTATAVAQVNVLNNPVTPTITASGATSVCPGGSVVLFASNAANYQWSNGPTTPFIVATQSGAYTVTATGLNGCSATSLPVNVFIGDNTAPVITAPLNVTVTPNLGCEAIGVTLGSPVTSDNCSVASVSNDAPAIFPIGTTTVTWTVTDASGNTSTATQIVTVVDQTAPTALAPANVTVSSNNYCEATGVDLGLPFATDNCTNNLVITNNAPATYPLGTTTVTWTITDAAGNITTVDQTVTVVDQTAPVLLLANTSVILDAAGYATIGFEDLDNGSFDNCGIAGAVLSQSAFDCSNVGNNLVSVILTDNNGNQTTAQVMVTVVASDACGSSNWAGPNVPDAFTPNGNNYNDTWVIPGLEGYNTKEMAVYSRYGTLVHYSGQYNNDWDGTLLNTGTPVPDGTYYYILNLDGGKQLNGYVYINRVKQ
jgi:gliding motility-associated-like protein